MKLEVTLVTPERSVLSAQADFLVVPAEGGELGILPKHTALIAQLKVGEVRLRRGAELERIAISGGFIEIHANQVSLFAETAEMAREIDVERARQAAERAKSRLHGAAVDRGLHEAEAALRRALVRLRVVEAVQRSVHFSRP
jgi:F-type H+-transporting ATPase subunit epsilon